MIAGEDYDMETGEIIEQNTGECGQETADPAAHEEAGPTGVRGPDTPEPDYFYIAENLRRTVV